MKLKISNDLSLPLEFVTQTQGIVAKRGSGKSYLASVQAEEMLAAKLQIVVADPTGAWYGLRSSADGKGEGYPILVMGGEHGDVPLEEHAGELIASAIVEERFSAILDLSLFRKGQLNRFMGQFLEALYRLNRNALHLFVDEADAVAPQRPFGDEARTLGAMEDIVRRGRIRGIGCTVITQRPAVLNKNVLTQCQVLTALRLVHPKDINAVMEWVNVHADPAQAKQMVDSLPHLPIGTSWMWSPGWPDDKGIFERIKIRERKTFDSGATPKAGEKRSDPKVLAPVDVQKLGKAITETAEKAKANDPKALRAELATTRASLAKALAAKPVAPAKENRVEIPVLKDGQLARLEVMAERIQSMLLSFQQAWQHITAAIIQVRQPTTVAPFSPARPAPSPAPPIRAPAVTKTPRLPTRENTNGDATSFGKSGKRKMMIALAQNPEGLTPTKLSLLTGIARSGGTWRTYLGELRGGGHVEDLDDGKLRITQTGFEALGEFKPLPTGIARSGGTWRTYIGELRGLELIGGKEDLKASADLFA